MRQSIKQILMFRDGMSENEALSEIQACQEDLHERLRQGELPSDLCEEWFGLEPDYMDELMI